MSAPAQLRSSLGAAPSSAATVNRPVSFKVTINAHSQLFKAVVHATARVSSFSFLLLRQLNLVRFAVRLPAGVVAAVPFKDGSGFQKVTHKIRLLLSTEMGIIGFTSSSSTLSRPRRPLPSCSAPTLRGRSTCASMRTGRGSTIKSHSGLVLLPTAPLVSTRRLSAAVRLFSSGESLCRGGSFSGK